MFDMILQKISIIKYIFFGPLKCLDNYLSESKKLSCYYAPFGFYSCLEIWCFVKFEKSSKRIKSPIFNMIL